MTEPAIKRMTVPEFLAWAESREATHHELVHGEIVAMAPERAEHVEAKRRAANALEDAITSSGVTCQAFVEGLAVAVDEETSYIPDAPLPGRGTSCSILRDCRWPPPVCSRKECVEWAARRVFRC
jgi:Uma2 family endonuclease